MTSQEVIKLGQQIVKPEINNGWLMPVIGISLLILSGIVWSKASSIKFILTRVIAYFMIILITVTSICYIAYTLDSGLREADKKYEAELLEWKTAVALPFIESLPLEKKEIVYIKIDPELSVTQPHYKVSPTEIQRTALTLSYKDNGKLVTRTDWYETNMTLTSEEEPYIEYRALNKYLGHGIKASLYGTKVYLPESYKFTDIK
jgi:hypothetical protein